MEPSDESNRDILLLRSAVALLNKLSTAQRIGLMLAAIFNVVGGMLHFIKPQIYMKIIPPYILWHVSMVRGSGFLEVLGGLGLLVPQTRRAAAWGLVALLIAVFPANIYMATNPIDAAATSVAPVLRWGRLPLQLFLILWLLWCSKPRFVLRRERGLCQDPELPKIRSPDGEEAAYAAASLACEWWRGCWS